MSTSLTLPPPILSPLFGSWPPSPIQTTLLLTLPTCKSILFFLQLLFLSQITPDNFLQWFHPPYTHFLTSLPHSLLLWTFDTKYLHTHVFMCFYGWLSFLFFPAHTVPPLLAIFFQLLSFSLQITMWSANIINHRDSCLISSVSRSITIVIKKGLRLDPWCSPFLNLKAISHSRSSLHHCHTALI